MPLPLTPALTPDEQEQRRRSPSPASNLAASYATAGPATLPPAREKPRAPTPGTPVPDALTPASLGPRGAQGAEQRPQAAPTPNRPADLSEPALRRARATAAYLANSGSRGAAANQSGDFTTGVARGIDTTQAAFGGAAEVAGQVLGSEGVESYGRGVRERNEAEAGENAARVPGVTNVRSLGDAADWAQGVAGELLPQMGPSLAGSAAGATLGAIAGPGGAIVGGLLGAFLPSFAQGVGETQGAIAERGGESPAAAIIGGGVIGALDAFTPGKLGSQLVRRFGREQAEVIGQKSLKRELAEAMATEGLTEAAQGQISEIAAALGTDTEYEVDWRQMVDEFAAGALGGGLATAAVRAAGAVAGPPTPPEEAPPEEGPIPLQPAPAPEGVPSDPTGGAPDPLALGPIPQTGIVDTDENRPKTVGEAQPPVVVDGALPQAAPEYQGGLIDPIIPPGQSATPTEQNRVLKSDGTPFANAKAAERSRTRRNLDESFEVVEVEGGFALERQAATEGERDATDDLRPGQAEEVQGADGAIAGKGYAVLSGEADGGAERDGDPEADVQAEDRVGAPQDGEQDREAVTERTSADEEGRDDAAVAVQPDAAEQPGDDGRGATQARAPTDREGTALDDGAETVVSGARQGALDDDRADPARRTREAGEAEQLSEAGDTPLAEAGSVPREEVPPGPRTSKQKPTAKLTPKQRAAKRREVDPQRDDILTAISKMGGIDTGTETDLTGRLLHIKTPVGMPNLERPKERGGRLLDDLAVELMGQGYLDDNGIGNGADSQALIEVIEAAASGKKFFSTLALEELIDPESNFDDQGDPNRNLYSNELLDEFPDGAEEYASSEGAGQSLPEDSYPSDVSQGDRTLADLMDDVAATGVPRDSIEKTVESMAFAGDDTTTIMSELFALAQDRRNAQAAERGSAESGGAQPDASLLESYSESDIAGRDEAASNTRAREQEAEQRARQQDTADDFALTGSARAADEAAARGQLTLDDTDTQASPAATIDTQANEAATSDANALPTPTEAQKEAGNYKVGRVKLAGMDISIENPKGSKREGIAPDGTKWSNTMASHYGYVRGSEAIDGDHVDVFLTDDATDESRAVFVIDQVDPKTGKYDEPKAIIGAANEADARVAYLANYDKGWQGLGAITEMPLADFKAWAQSPAAKKALALDGKGKAKGGGPKVSMESHIEKMNEIIASKLEGLRAKEGKGKADAKGGAPTIAPRGIDKVQLPKLQEAIAAGTIPTRVIGKPDETPMISIEAPYTPTRADGAMAEGFDKVRMTFTDYGKGEGYRLTDLSYARKVGGSNGGYSVGTIPAGATKRALAAVLKHHATKTTKPTKGAKATKPDAAPKLAPKPADYGTKNTIFTADAADAARALLKKKLGNLNAGLDPEMMTAGITLAGYHIEAGARSFADFSASMIDDLGEAARPLLRSWYEGVRYYPGIDSEGLTPSAEIDSASDSNTDLEPDSAERPDEEVPSADGAGRGGDGESAGAGGDRTREEGGEPEGNPGNDDGGGATDRAPGNRRPRSSTGSRGGASQRGDGGRGATSRDGGVQPDRGGRDSAEKAAAKGRSERLTGRQKQEQAEGVKSVAADLENIRKTLPALLAPQQEDVLFAEQRLADNAGVLFTNGTGTGKTYTGLGVIKRFVREGRDNVLIVVPSDKIAHDWKNSARDLLLDVKALKDTRDNGTSGVAITTYANFGQNRSLMSREWDLIVADESHKLNQSAQGKPSRAQNMLRALTNHPGGLYSRARHTHRKEIEALETKKSEWIRQNMHRFDLMAQADRAAATEFGDEANVVDKKIRATLETLEGAPMNKAVFLSATPFAYVKSIDYGEGFVFDYPQTDDTKTSGYNEAVGREKFMQQNFGFRMRYNKLTQPDADVDVGVMERQFNEGLKQSGALRGRKLEVDADYSRQFVTIDDAVGAKIDYGLEVLTGYKEGTNEPNYPELSRVVRKNFNYLVKSKLLEAIKVRHAIPRIREHMALGRQVVLFHSYNVGGAGHPFQFDAVGDAERKEIAKFMSEHPDLWNLDLSGLRAPIDVLAEEFPDAMFINGRQPKKVRRENADKFNDDANTAANLIVLQIDAGKEGISLHDTTGKYPRVYMNLGLPIKPTDTTQAEGRIYRTGQASDAVFEYFNTGTYFERHAFAEKVATRSSTAENLALGNDARDLLTAFVDGFEQSDKNAPSLEQGKGGKDGDRARKKLTPFEAAKTHYFGRQKRTSRDKSREGTDYFATPEPLGQKMVEFARLAPLERALEPSTGHGAIGRYFPESTRNTFIEPSTELASEARLRIQGKMIEGRFEDHHQSNKYDAIIMNPPFGSGGSTAISHLALATKRLAEGGRIVAIIPEGPAADKKFERWFEDAPGMHMLAEIGLPAVTFGRAGTKVKARIVVLDKASGEKDQIGPQRSRRDIDAETPAELFDAIESMEMPVRPTIAEPVEEAPAVRAQANKATGLAAHRLAFDPTTRAVTGKGTYANKGTLRELGAKWDRARVGWVMPEGVTEADIERAIDESGDEAQFSRADTARAAEPANTEPVPDTGGKVRSLNDTLARFFGDERFRDAYEPARLPRDTAEIGAAVKGAFGKDIIGVSPTRPGGAEDFFDGVYIPSQRDAVYINTRADADFAQVTGHELYHAIGRDRPDLKKWLEAQSKSYIKNADRYRDKLEAQRRGGDGAISEAMVLDEILADFSGDALSDPAFLKQLAEDNPGRFKQLLAVITRWLSGIAKKLKTMGSDQYVSDVEAMRDYYRTVIDSYVNGKPTPAAIDDAPAFMVAWHGTPHAFEKFSTDKIGTGEGVQAFGHGLYFASAREVADSYRKDLTQGHEAPATYAGVKLTAKEAGFDNEHPANDAIHRLSYHLRNDLPPGRAIELAQEHLAGELDRNASILKDMPEHHWAKTQVQEIAEAQDWLRTLDPEQLSIDEAEPGALYQVNLQPTEDEYLLWDEPLEGQSEVVRNALASIGIDDSKYSGDISGGKYLYNYAVGNEMRDSGLPPSMRKAAEKQASGRLLKAGIRGIKYLDGASRNKGDEGAYNYVIFDDSDVEVQAKFSRRRPVAHGFAIPEETLAEVAIRKVQDKHRVLNRLQASIVKAGGRIRDKANAYVMEELFHGRVENDLRKMSLTHIEPLAKLMARYGIEQKMLDRFLYARHAPERNDHIASINPNKPDGGSGWTYAKAEKVMKEMQASGKIRELERLARMVDDMIASQRDVMQDGGLASDDQVDAWRSHYKYYVPLKGFADDEPASDIPRTGKGFNVRGREVIAALGRGSEAASPSSYAIQDLTEKVIRKRKNEVGNALLQLVEDHPEAGYWNIYTDKKPEYTERTDKNTGQVVRERVSMALVAGYENSPYLTTKRKGITYYIKMEDTRLAKAMKNLGPETNNGVIRFMSAYNRILSMMLTSLNPEFLVSNFSRDVPTVALNLSAEQTRDDGKIKEKAIVAQTLKTIPAAMRGAFLQMRGKDGGEWGKLYEQFMEDGGKTGWFDMKDIAGQQKALERMISMAKGGAKGKALSWFKESADMVEHINSAVENAVRLAAYKAAIDAGTSRMQAASLAKNASVNFNRRGEMGTTLNALYIFANASIQGSANFARTMIGFNGDGKPAWRNMNRAQKLAVGIAAGAYTLAMANRMAAGEDEDGENWYSKVPDHVKERNLVIMKSLLGGEQDGTFWEIPLPYGYNVFSVLGTGAEAVAGGGESVGKATTDMALAVLGSFSPIGFSDSKTVEGLFLKNATPTIASPLVDVALNENFHGSSIYQDNLPFGLQKPDSSLGRQSTPAAFTAVAKWMNEVTGGSDFRSGGVDVNPDVILYFFREYGGGALGFAEKVGDVAARAATGVEIEPHRVPFLGRVSGKVLPYADRNTFYERRGEIEQLYAERRALAPEDRGAWQREFGSVVRLRPVMRQAEKQMKGLREHRDRVYAMDHLSPRELDQRLSAIEKRMKTVVDRFNIRYARVTKE